MAKNSLHRGLQKFSQLQCQWPKLKKVPYRFLMVDGTGVTIQDGMGHTVGRTEMRWALVSLGERRPFEPVGFWVDTHWATIAQDLKARLDNGKLEVLFSDGGPRYTGESSGEGHSPLTLYLAWKGGFSISPLYAVGLKSLNNNHFGRSLILSLLCDWARLTKSNSSLKTCPRLKSWPTSQNRLLGN